ncbi:MAG: 1,4-alpha-glucan branching enzyme, partial [Acidobacteria bacterium]|nr:1,4-alpha-glucan branching enzyme [Acidobacteriota bacterium]
MIRAMEPALTPELEALLHAWLPQQRWFPVKSGEFSLTPSARMAVGEPSALVGLEIIILTLHFTASDGSARSEVIQVPLSNRSAELGTADLALVGQLVDQEHGERWVYDALHDPVFVASWLDFLATESHSSGAIVGHSSAAFRASRTPGSLGRSRVLGGEQSNTSVVIPNSALPVILKFFRVLSPGDNPEVVVGSALTEAGCTEVPAVHGWATGQWLAGGQQVSGHLCVMAEFIRGSEDVWSLAVASARAGSTFTHQAVRLGAALAHVHTSLQGALGSHVASADERDALLNALAGRIRWAWGMAAAAVGPYEQQVDALLAQLPEEKELPLLQRIHGDLHLGQILHAGTPDGLVADRWLILDFEGEPLRPVSERNADDVAVRDVVGLLRSFDYAAAAAQSEEPEAVAVPAGWADECATALLAGYQQAGGVAIDQDSPLFLALWLDKALYEVVYELRNRPHWVHIPVAAVRWALERNESGEPMKSIHGENSAASSASVPAAAVPATPGTEPEPTPTASVPVPVPVEADVLARVAEASYHAPHSVLGGHVGDDGAVTIRSVRHLASAVTLVTEAGRTPMTHELGGVWVATVDPLIPGHTPDYRLEVEYPDGFMTLADDPYRFLPTVGELDLHLMGEGRHESLWQVLGAHVHRYPSALGDVQGVGFSVWAPNAQAVRVKGEFNKWDARHHGMRTLGSSGVWELFIPDVVPGARYKYEILTRSGQWIEKADPMAYGTEVPPLTASRVVESSYEFKDSDWLAARAQRDPHNSPMSVYEVHLGSWRLGLDYTQLARELVEYVQWMGFTHVELMPVAEHPFGGS